MSKDQSIHRSPPTVKNALSSRGCFQSVITSLPGFGLTMLVDETSVYRMAPEKKDLLNLEDVKHAAQGVNRVWHLAANSDIRAGGADPEVDLRDTFLTTFNTLRLMREMKIPQIAFASTSAIYGVLPGLMQEDMGPLFPISNYGAMKLASEACISAALEAWLQRAWFFRFPNVVGSRSTHGVIYDFVQKLKANPAELEVLGDGTQEKPYFHVADLLDAMLFIVGRAEDKLNYFNIGTADTLSTVRYIAETVIKRQSPGAKIRYTGGNKGWVGDVPKFNYSIEKLQRLGWSPRLSSNAAVDRAVEEIVSESRNP